MADSMRPATQAEMQFACALHIKFIALGRIYKQNDLTFGSIPPSVKETIASWMSFFKRANLIGKPGVKADLRIKESEVKAMQDVAEFVLRESCRLQKSPLPKTKWTPGGVSLELLRNF